MSKYSNQRSSMTAGISGKNLLDHGFDQSKENEIKNSYSQLVRQSDKLKNHRTNIESKIQDDEHKCTELKEEKQKMNSIFLTLSKCKDKLQLHTNRIKNLKESISSVDEEQLKFTEQSKRLVIQLFSLNQQKVDLYKKYSEAHTKYDTIREHLSIFNRDNVDINNEIDNCKNNISRATQLAEKITEVYERNKNICTTKRDEAMRKTGGTKPNDKNFPFKRDFEELPGSMEDLQAHIDDLLAQISCLSTNDKKILEDFETRQQHIQRLTQLIENSATTKADFEQQMQSAHDKWYLNISSVVETINQYFSRFMAAMKYAGEVDIVRKNERDYADYGIEIRVKYRDNEKLQKLDRYTQSGGERAVAIAIYTLSLQLISHVPFRCVDEINQGMDPRNERKFFNMLVKQTSMHPESQFFFVTPKLLPNLKWNNYMTVLLVHNGAANQSNFCGQEEIKTYKPQITFN